MRLDLSDFEQDLAGRHTSLDVLRTLCSHVAERVPAEKCFAVQLDPATLLDVGGYGEPGFPVEYLTKIVEIEHLTPDEPGGLRDLMAGPDTARLLSRFMGGRLEESAYYREILRPQGLGDELRVLLRDGPYLWGLLLLCRKKGDAAFTPAEEETAVRFGAAATEVLRRVLLMQGVDTGSVPDAPGRLIVGVDGAVRSASPTARAWLDRVEEDGESGRQLHGTIDAALFSGTARAEIPLSGGAVLAVRAWSTRLEDDERAVAVSLGPRPPDVPSAVVLAAYGLTPQEEGVALHILRGSSIQRIAERLSLPAETVEDLLASVFHKTGMRDRGTFVSDVLCRHYLPLFGRGPLTTDGRRLATPS